jgi:phage terminase small subunit
MAGMKGRSGGPRKNAGGARPGAGRKPKPLEITVGDCGDATPLEFLESVMRNPSADDQLRVKAAIAAAQYRHPKVGDAGKKDAKKDAAKDASTGRFGPAAPPRLVAVK